MENVIEEIAMDIVTFKEDHPEVIITDDMIKGIVECYMEQLIDEIREEVSQMVIPSRD